MQQESGPRFPKSDIRYRLEPLDLSLRRYRSFGTNICAKKEVLENKDSNVPTESVFPFLKSYRGALPCVFLHV
jgi:hypothetical protein